MFAASTALILFLAANTSFNAFPRLAAILSEDGYMPRQFSFRGDRLAYSWGIVLLAAIAFGILWAFGGDTHALIPLYSVGVFLCFTLSQTGMVRHWLRVREPGWRWRLGVNALGGVLTAVVLGIVVFEKFEAGAYLVVIIVPVLVAMMLFISRQYARSARQLAVDPALVVAPPQREERVVVPIAGLDRASIQAINVGRSIDDDIRAVYVSTDPDGAAAIRADFERQVPGVPLVVVESPYRALAGPLLAYLDVLDAAWPPDKPDPITFVVIPEYVARSWWERILYNQSAKRLRKSLLGRRHTVVVNVPYRREDPEAEAKVSPPSEPGTGSTPGLVSRNPPTTTIDEDRHRDDRRKDIDAHVVAGQGGGHAERPLADGQEPRALQQPREDPLPQQGVGQPDHERPARHDPERRERDRIGRATRHRREREPDAVDSGIAAEALDQERRHDDRRHRERRRQPGRDRELGQRRPPAGDGLREEEDDRAILDLGADGRRAEDERDERQHGPDHERVEDLGRIAASAAEADEQSDQHGQGRQQHHQQGPSAAEQAAQRHVDERPEGGHRPPRTR